MSKVHEVKCWPDFFVPIIEGARTFDLRKNDRKYAAGDTLVLCEFDDRKGQFTGLREVRRITYVLDGIGPGCITPLQGLARGYCILGLAKDVS